MLGELGGTDRTIGGSLSLAPLLSVAAASWTADC